MTDLRKGAEMAFEVSLHELLEGVPEDARLVIDSEDGMSTRFIPVGHLCKRASIALRQALAQPEQESVCAHGVEKTKCDFCKQPEQWVELTDDEILNTADVFGSFQYGDSQGHKRLEFAKAVEAKLKEKNV